MTFTEAAAFKMPWGQFRGKALDDIASDDEGLRYLGWLHDQGIKDPRVRPAVVAYLEDKTIAKELERVKFKHWRSTNA